MTPHLLLFYLFATIAVAGAVMVVSARNPVHSVLFLILTFFNAAALFVLIGAEFLAMVLVVVYVGAVAVLFMFVVMMLNVNFVKLRQGVMQYLPIGGLVGLILLVELLLVAGTWTLAPAVEASPPRPTTAGLSNTEALGNLLYTEYFYLFQTAGVILLVAIIGAITLTLRERGDVRRQDVYEQVHRDRARSVELRKVRSRAGI